jgi:hypothetical protein
MVFNPRDWYWAVVGNSATVFSSSSGSYVSITDPTYLKWCSISGNVATRIVSEEDLTAVLSSAGVSVSVPSKSGLSSYAMRKQLNIQQGGISVNIGTVGSPVMVSASTDTSSLVLLQGALASAQAVQWVQNNGTAITMTSAQVGAVFAAVTSFIQSTFTALAAVLGQINSGTIKSTADVNAFAWPVNS